MLIRFSLLIFIAVYIIFILLHYIYFYHITPKEINILVFEK